MLRQPRPLVPYTFPFTGQSYAQRIINTQHAHLIGYWKLDETSGSNAADSSGQGQTATIAGASLNAATFLEGSPIPFFDGSSDYVALPASFLSLLNTAEGTINLWAKFDAATWVDGITRYAFIVQVDAGNRIRILKTATSNQLSFNYAAGGASQGVSVTLSDTTFLMFTLTWSKSADQMKAYVNGAQTGTTQTGLGSWAGSPSIYSISLSSSSSAFLGNLGQVALWNTPLSADEIAALAAV